MLVEPCSRGTRCVEIKLQFFFGKYMSIYTVNILIQLISAFLYDLLLTHGGSNFWKNTAPNTKMELWSLIFLPSGKQRAIDNVTSLF